MAASCIGVGLPKSCTIASVAPLFKGDDWKETNQLGTGDLMNAVRVLQGRKISSRPNSLQFPT